MPFKMLFIWWHLSESGIKASSGFTVMHVVITTYFLSFSFFFSVSASLIFSFCWFDFFFSVVVFSSRSFSLSCDLFVFHSHLFRPSLVFLLPFHNQSGFRLFGFTFLILFSFFYIHFSHSSCNFFRSLHFNEHLLSLS